MQRDAMVLLLAGFDSLGATETIAFFWPFGLHPVECATTLTTQFSRRFDRCFLVVRPSI